MSAITVDELLEKPFTERTYEEKIKIVSDQKPRPSLRVLYRDERDILIEAEFNVQMYDKINWLTACEKRKTFFCWPCLLILPPSKWNSGIDDLQYVLDHSEQHEEEPKHLEAVFKLHLFIMVNFKNSSAIFYPKSNQKSFSISDSDHSVLICLIDAICYGISEVCANSYKCNMLKDDECIKFLNLLKPSIYYTDSIDKLKEAPEIINGLVDAITIVLKGVIESEIKESTYACMILSEHVLNKEKSQISTVLRYLTNGEVHERFIGFNNSVGSRMQHEDVAEHFFKMKKAYHIRGKVLALSVDGAVLPCPKLSKLFDLDTFQCKYLIPSYFHELGRVLIQSVLHLEECELFFRTVREIESCFKNEDNLHRLERILIGDGPYFKKKKWYSSSPFIVLLSLYRKYFIIFFKHDQIHLKYVSAEDRAKAATFKTFLENLKTIFLLKTFAKIFQDHFDKNLNFTVNLFATNFNIESTKFRSNIERLETDGFAKLWIEANLEKIGEKAEESMKLKAFNNPEKKSYIKLFENILNQISMEIKYRQKDIPRLAFCNLFNNLGDLVFEERLVKLLLFELKSYFDETTLKNEITVLKSTYALAFANFQNKSTHDIMATIKEYDLFDVFSQVHKLAEFILTMPFSPPSKDIKYTTTKLKQIEEFSYIPEATGILSGDISVLCIENKLLLQLQTVKTFYDDVIKIYSEMKRNGKFHQGYFS